MPYSGANELLLDILTVTGSQGRLQPINCCMPLLDTVANLNMRVLASREHEMLS